MISLDDQIREVRREISMRHSVYARRVEAGKMTRANADRLVEVMQAVVSTLEEHKRFMEAKL